MLVGMGPVLFRKRAKAPLKLSVLLLLSAPCSNKIHPQNGSLTGVPLDAHINENSATLLKPRTISLLGSHYYHDTAHNCHAACLSHVSQLSSSTIRCCSITLNYAALIHFEHGVPHLQILVRFMYFIFDTIQPM